MSKMILQDRDDPPRRVNYWLRLASLTLVLFFIFLATFRLGENSLWHDEAEVGVAATSIVRTGLPTMIGANGFIPVGRNDQYHTPQSPFLYRIQTWLMFYVGALGILLFGQTALGLRLPFLLFGVGTIIGLFALTSCLYRDKRTAWITIGLLAFSPQFLLLIREARYYSLVMFFSTIAMWGFVRGFMNVNSSKSETHGKWYRAAFFLSLFGLFHSHYLSFFAVLPGFVVWYLLVKKYGTPSNKALFYASATPFVLGIGVLLIIAFGWIIAFSGSTNVIHVPQNIHALGWMDAVTEVLKKLNRTIPLLWILAGIYMMYRKYSSKEQRNPPIMLMLVSMIVSVIGVVSFVTFLQIPPSIHPEFRYILPIYPLCFIFVAYVLVWLPFKNQFIRVAMFGLLMFTNIFSVPIEAVSAETYWPLVRNRIGVHSYLGEFVGQELLKGYTGPVDELLRYITTHGHDGEKIFASSEGISLQYHLPNYIVENDYSYLKNHNERFDERALLDYRWLVFRSACPIECVFDDPYEAKKVLETNFVSHELQVEDYIVQNREEIPYHLFAPSLRSPRVSLYENVNFNASTK